MHLVRRQHIHGKVAGLLEHGMAVGALVDAPQHQRRVEGYRVETVGRHAHLAPGDGGGGDHGHASGKIAQGATKGPWVEYVRHARLPGGLYGPP